MGSGGDPVTEVFGSGVEDDFGHGCFVAEGSDKYNKGWTVMTSCMEGQKEGPGQEQRKEEIDSEWFLGPFVEPMEHGSYNQYETRRG